MSQVQEPALDAETSTERPSHKHVWFIYAAFLLTSIIFDLIFEPLYKGQHAWYQAGDLNAWLRASQYISWGWIGGVYAPGSGVLTLPGFAILLTPVAWITDYFHWAFSIPDPIPYPSAWPLLYLYALSMAIVPLVALDSLASRLHLRQRARVLLTLAEAIVLWQVIAFWGHPEDGLAVAFAVWSLLAVLDGKMSKAGWLMAAGLCFQPLVVLMIPILWSQASKGDRLPYLLRSASLPALMILILMISNPHGTWTALHLQASPPKINHATPWVYVAPKVGHGGYVTSTSTHSVLRNGHYYYATITSRKYQPATVAQGMSNLLGIIIAGVIGLWLFYRKRKLNLSELVWWLSLALALRCVLTPVMTTYYFWPYTALALVLTFCYSRKWLPISAFLLMVVQIRLAYLRVTPWGWFLPQVALTVIILGLAYMAIHEKPVISTSREPISDTAASPALDTALDTALDK